MIVSITGPSIEFAVLLLHKQMPLWAEMYHTVVISQSDSSHQNSTNFKVLCTQVYQTLLLLHVKRYGSKTIKMCVVCNNAAPSPTPPFAFSR